jgi:hypothetical protein
MRENQIKVTSPIDVHEECMCAASETQLALYAERERLSKIVDLWVEAVNKHHNLNLSADGIAFEYDWYPDEKYCYLDK